MMQSISAALKLYNMNSSNKRVGDCFKRALALAFKKDYDVVKNELNKMVRNGQAWRNNDYNTLAKYIKQNGGKQLVDGTYDDSSVKKFCEEHPVGTYLVFTNKDQKAHFSNHIVAIIDGDAYDSWDSEASKIFHAFQVSTDARQLHFDNVADMRIPVIEKLLPLLEKYLIKLFDKYTNIPDTPISDIELEYFKPYGKDTLECELKCYLIPDRISKQSESYTLTRRIHDITLKLDINLDADENAERLWPKLKQKVYDWMYNIYDEIKISNKIATVKQYKFYGDKTIYKAIPDELWPYVWSADRMGSYSEYKYEVTLHMPEDSEYHGAYIDFHADTVKEMRDRLLRFYNYGEREGVDY